MRQSKSQRTINAIIQTSVTSWSPKEVCPSSLPSLEAYLRAILYSKVLRVGQVVVRSIPMWVRHTLLPRSCWRKAGPSPAIGASERTRKLNPKIWAGVMQKVWILLLVPGLEWPTQLDSEKIPYQTSVGELQLLLN